MNLQLNKTPKVRERLEEFCIDSEYLIALIDDTIAIDGFATTTYLPDSMVIGFLREFVEAEGTFISDDFDFGCEPGTICTYHVAFHQGKIIRNKYKHQKYVDAFLEVFTKWTLIREKQL